MKLPRLLAALRNRPSDGKPGGEWKNIEYFDPVWEERVVALARMIKGRGRLVDFGCGQQYLRKHLPAGTQYIPVDYTSRSADTIVADFNQLPYPKIDGDIAFISGFLEYVEDAPGFIRYLKEFSYQEIVMSYCCIESVSVMEERQKLAWKSHLSLKSLLAEVLDSFNLCEIGAVTKNTLLRFERKK